jgi:hypothetical protein
MEDIVQSKDDRPYHICPDCSAYNAKFLEACWRCERDLTAGALEPKGVMGFRLSELEKASKSDNAG